MVCNVLTRRRLVKRSSRNLLHPLKRLRIGHPESLDCIAICLKMFPALFHHRMGWTRWAAHRQAHRPTRYQFWEIKAHMKVPAREREKEREKNNARKQNRSIHRKFGIEIYMHESTFKRTFESTESEEELNVNIVLIKTQKYAIDFNRFCIDEMEFNWKLICLIFFSSVVVVFVFFFRFIKACI